MTLFNRLRDIWRSDRLLQSVVKNTGYLFSSNTISMVLTSVQGILAAALLGPAGYGTLGLIVAFTSSVNRLLSFRMGEVVVRYAGQYLALGHRDRAAAAVKIAGLTEASASVLAYVLLVLIAPWGAVSFVKDASAAFWINIYGLALLANLVTETGTAVLQLSNQFRSQAVLNLAQSILTALWILIAFFTHAGVYTILMAYLAGKAVFGIGILVLALRALNPLLGPGWIKAPLHAAHKGEGAVPGIVGFAFSTNLSGTINLLIRDSEVLWVGLFFSPVEAGYLKFALAIMNIIMMPITPFISTTFPEIARSVATHAWKALRALLRRTTVLAFVWTAACGLGMLLVGPWLLAWFKGGAYLPAFPALLILLVGYGFANIFFWNRPLLLAFGKPNYPLAVTAAVGAVKTVLMLVLWVPMDLAKVAATPWLAWSAPLLAPLAAAPALAGVRSLGFLAQASLLSGYFIISIALIVRWGWRKLHRIEADENARGLTAPAVEPSTSRT
jgi:O-antigen/teichoic acid export membrane protein